VKIDDDVTNKQIVHKQTHRNNRGNETTLINKMKNKNELTRVGGKRNI
jgi:hypothetical protein